MAAKPLNRSGWWRRIRRRIPGRLMMVYGFFAALVIGVPYFCSVAWLLRADPEWERAAQQTGLLWIFGLVVQMIILTSAASSRKVLSDEPPLIQTIRTTLAGLGLIVTALALTLGLVNIAGVVAFAAMPLVKLIRPLSRAQMGSPFKVIAGLVAAASLLAGSTEGVIVGGIGALLFSYFKPYDFWQAIARKPSREGYLLDQHRVCSVGGG
ncbi:MAG TPA: hypothetical protein VGL56_00535 [Fimbriimonadaceae bacterium]|jgi:hypothetical protein